MRVFLGVLSFIILLAIVFFCFNYSRLEVYKLDDGIGSVSVVNLDLFSPEKKDNVNTYIAPIISPSLPFGARDIDFIVNPYAIEGVNVRQYWNEILEFSETGVFDGFNWFFNPLNDEYKGGVRIVIPDFDLPFKPLSDVRYTPEEFYNEFPNGLTVEYDNARMYRFLYFTTSDSYFTIRGLTLKIYCAPDPLNTSNYIINVIPISVKYDYNMVKVVQQLNFDIDLIQNGKPIYPPNDPQADDLKFWEKLYSLIVYPLNYVGYVAESTSIILNDISGLFIINDISRAKF